ncbi:MAG: hypothetical protein JWM56_706 [Candidatus Peribacteria bacterium]|nr:hypothetical protein [Candidatus Peribacteria bacterium]
MRFPFFSNHGILGLNARNLLYIRPHNPRKAVAFADDKLKTKAFLSARGIPVAKIYARIDNREQLRSFDFSALPDECVLKPNNGFGGEGIILLKGRKKGLFLDNGKEPISTKRLIEHIEDILDGKFSVNGRADTAFFERILKPHEGFAPFRPAGLPDIRIIVFNLVPVMAMLRVPTAESNGKANVHQGGIGIGIDIAKGVTTHATQYNRVIRELPHGMPPSGITLPFWEDLLLIASRIQYTTNIGYLAVDLTIDEEQGPVLLEVNARAGLMVQVANLAPLRTRLNRVEGLTVTSPEKGVRLAQDLFGQKVQRTVYSETRPQLGTRETLLVHGSKESVEVSALLAPGMLERTVFAPDLIAELRELGGVEQDGVESMYRVKFTLGGKRLQTVVYEEVPPLPGVRAVIGRRDLTGFLIDPSKKEIVPVVLRRKLDVRAADRLIGQMDRELMILRHVKPLNLREERRRIAEDPLYNPLFLYAESSANLDDSTKKLEAISLDDSPMGTLLQKKRRELFLRMELIRARGDAERFTRASIALFGEPGEALTRVAGEHFFGRTACDIPPPASAWMTAEETVPLFEQSLKAYGLHDWQISVRDTLVADCTVGWKRLYLRSGARFAPDHVSSLVAHEVETHILTLENGNHQPYDLFRRGFAGYLDTQEGLAVFNQNRVLSPYHEKRIGPARSVLAVVYSLHHSFARTRAYLTDTLDYTPEKAITKAIELKRGLSDTSVPGSFTKGIVYFRGLRAIERFVEGGGDIRRLYVGKVALEDIDLAEQIPDLKPPLFLPSFMRLAAADQVVRTGSKKQKDDEDHDAHE